MGNNIFLLIEMRLTQLDGLLAFVAVAKHRGFNAAATELGITSPALSQAVRQLEERLGVRLFNRTTRSVALTEAGAEFLKRVAPAINDLHDASELLDQYRDKPTGLLRLNAPRVVAATLLRSIVPEFHAAYPDVRIEVFIDDRLCDIVAEGFDAGFRLGDSVENDMIAAPIGPPMQIAVVGSPKYFRGRAQPTTIAALRDHELVRYRSPSSGQFYKWEFVVEGQPVEYETHGTFICNDSVMMIEAALDGLGMAYTFDIAVADHIRAERLIRVLKPFSPHYPGFYIYYAGRRQVPLKLRRFIEFARRMHDA